jgi:ribulose 1,5-bisphosphate carboxylase large subunit-like protein
MKKQELSKTQIRLENKAFWNYLHKKYERLTMILDFNVKNGLDIIKSDEDLLLEEYEAYDRSDLSWTVKSERTEQTVTQKKLYTDEVAEKK